MGCCLKRTGPEEVRILMVGLDNAGKTTILYQLKMGETVKTIPTIGFNVETLDYQGINITVWDVGGQDKIRILWKHYYHHTDGIIFVVDSNDRDRLEDAAEELKKMINEEELIFCPILVWANKQDLNGALPPGEITEVLNMGQYSKRLWLVQGSSATTGFGLKEGLDWIKENYRKCGVCDVRVTMKLSCDCYICENCVYEEFSEKLKKDENDKFIFEEINVCRCDNNLTKKEFNTIFNNKKVLKERKELKEVDGARETEEVEEVEE